MSDTLFEVTGIERIGALKAIFDELPAHIYKQLQSDLWPVAERLGELAEENAPEKTGNLKAQIIARVVAKDSDTISIFAASKAPYGAIQNVGGTTRPHVISAINTKALQWVHLGTFLMYAKSVNHPGGTIKGTHYLQKGMEQVMKEFITVCEDAVATALINSMGSFE
jgi:hypothetical protein